MGITKNFRAQQQQPASARENRRDVLPKEQTRLEPGGKQRFLRAQTQAIQAVRVKNPIDLQLGRGGPPLGAAPVECARAYHRGRDAGSSPRETFEIDKRIPGGGELRLRQY